MCQASAAPFGTLVRRIRATLPLRRVERDFPRQLPTAPRSPLDFAPRFGEARAWPLLARVRLQRLPRRRSSARSRLRPAPRRATAASIGAPQHRPRGSRATSGAAVGRAARRGARGAAGRRTAGRHSALTPQRATAATGNGRRPASADNALRGCGPAGAEEQAPDRARVAQVLALTDPPPLPVTQPRGVGRRRSLTGSPPQRAERRESPRG